MMGGCKGRGVDRGDVRIHSFIILPWAGRSATQLADWD